MRKKTGTAYFEKLWKDMLAHFKTFVKNGGQVELHKFRVSVKKIKSLLVLCESGQKRGSLLKRMKPLQKIFKKAGQIRNAQINLQLSEKFESGDLEFFAQQRQVVSDGLAAFRANRKKYKRRLEKCHKDIAKHLQTLDSSTVRKFYKSNLEHISHFLKAPQFDEALHSCRKRIKNLLYNHNTANKIMKGKVKLDTDYLEGLQEKIGNWHDNIIVIDLLSPGEIPKNAILSRLETENTELETKIRDEGGNFEQKAVPLEVVS